MIPAARPLQEARSLAWNQSQEAVCLERRKEFAQNLDWSPGLRVARQKQVIAESIVIDAVGL